MGAGRGAPWRARSVRALGWLLLSAVAPGAASATDLTGQQVVLTYDFGNGSGTSMATVGPGPEFVLEGVPSNPGFSVATIDITADTLTLTHSRATRLGPGLPFVDDDFLQLDFPDLQLGIDTVSLTLDPMPEWFAGLGWTTTTIELEQLLDSAGVNTQLKVWTIAQQQGHFWGAESWGELVWGGAPAVPVLHGLGLVALSAMLVGAGARLTRDRGGER